MNPDTFMLELLHKHTQTGLHFHTIVSMIRVIDPSYGIPDVQNYVALELEDLKIQGHIYMGKNNRWYLGKGSKDNRCCKKKYCQHTFYASL